MGMQSWVFYADSACINRQEFEKGMPGFARNAATGIITDSPSTVTLLPFTHTSQSHGASQTGCSLGQVERLALLPQPALERYCIVLIL